MITVLVPAYNEEAVIGEFIETFQAECGLTDYELLIVNDGSKDKTAQIIKDHQIGYPELRLVDYPDNKGLGGALKTGFQEAKGSIIVTMDSDLTHPPSKVNELIRALDNADVSIASRYVKGGGMVGVPAWRVALSVVANTAFQILFFTRARDLTAGFKGYKASVIKSTPIKRTGFAVQLEIMVRLLKKGVKIKEVPLMLGVRKEGQGQSKFSIVRMLPKYFINILQLWAYRWFG